MSKKHSRVWSEFGYDPGYELGFFGEMLAIYAGATLLLITAPYGRGGWIHEFWPIVLAIVIAVSATTVAIVVATNQAELIWRVPFDILAIALSYGSVPVILSFSHDDLFPQRTELLALPTGVVVWVVARELAILFLNVLEFIRARVPSVPRGR